MRYAVVVRCPVEGGTLRAFADDEARTIPGVRGVLKIEPFVVGNELYGRVRGGLAVIADHPWAALKGAQALDTTWNEGAGAALDTVEIARRLEARASQPGDTKTRVQGDVAAALAGAEQVVTADYELPLLAHACMEPMTFTAQVSSERCRTWGPTQRPRYLQQLLAAGLGLPLNAVEVHPTLEGGGFGRRLAVDYGLEAALISRAAGVPVQVLWTREDDLRHDFYRTPSRHRMRAGLAAGGKVVAWHHHIVSSPLRVHIQGRGVEYPELYDVEGGGDFPGEIANVLVEYSGVDLGLQLGSWRSVSHSFNGFVVNCFIDEVARALEVDPLKMHLDLLGEARRAELSLDLPGRRGRPRCDVGRLRHVLEVVAARSGWGRSPRRGKGRGLAWCRFKRTYVAQVAEVTVSPQGRVAVDRVVTAIDCGRPVNPSGIEAQVEGAVMDGVATALKWEITVEGGRVRQGNFGDYPLLRLREAPVVETHIVESDEEPSGTGEPPYPAVPSAIANAVFAATGKRIRKLPIRPEDLRSS